MSELEIKTGDEIEDLNEYCPNEESAEKCLKCPYGKKTTQQGVINCGYAQRRWVSLDSLKARDAQRLTKINAEIKNTTNILEKASREQKTGDNEVYLTMAGRLGGLRWARTLLVEEAKT